MFHDVDESLRALLVADVPIRNNEVDIAFDRPTRDWASRLSRPTLNLFLYDIRERTDLRDDVPVITRDKTGQFVRRTPPKRMDLAYFVTAWTKEPDDEHRILGRVLACLYRHSEIPADHLHNGLRHAEHPTLLRVTDPNELINPHDLWGVLDNELRAPLSLIVTAPLEVFAPEVGPLVRTTEFTIAAFDQPPDARWISVGGLVHKKGDATQTFAAAQVRIVQNGRQTETDETGRFRFANLPPGDYTWRVTLPTGQTLERAVRVPTANYDVEV